MPPENVDLVRSICAAWLDGDFSSADWAHPDIEYVIADGPTPGHWTGLAGLAEGWRTWLTAWEDYSVEPEEYRELDDERVFVPVRFRGRGRGSGVEVARMGARGANLFHLRDGRVTRLVTFVHLDRALEALGLAK
jgi:ketosteroid isomerase-like protein